MDTHTNTTIMVRITKKKITQRIKRGRNKARTVVNAQKKRMVERGHKIKEEIIRHKVFLVVLGIIAIILLYDYLTGGFTKTFFESDTQQIVTQLKDVGSFAIPLYVIFVILEVVLAPIPSVVLYTAGGLLFGAFFGAALTFVGNIIGAAICYLLARYFFAHYFDRKISKSKLQTFKKKTDKYGAYTIFFLRLNPFTSSDIFSYAAGIVHMRFIPFIISTAAGLFPLILIQTYIGADLISKSPIISILFLIMSIVYIAGFIWFLVHRK
ncbi:MAG: putative membrane protein YdjX (TVP38/TMEM64 family) [Candidatus Woesearchaeota archaeon]|jgi:uncharacterized membrane protein YdjX (TVP38/TMEM64 family)